MTLREAVHSVVQDNPASFTSGQVIAVYQGRQIADIITESAFLPYKKKGRASDSSTLYVRIG